MSKKVTDTKDYGRVIGVRVNHKERAALEKYSESSGKTLSDIIREGIRGAIDISDDLGSDLNSDSGRRFC